MKKIYLIVIILLACIVRLQAQFNPEAAEKSLVRVIVTGGGKMSVCSGFMWKKKSWIVTSLHSMKPGGNIAIEYPGSNIRDARVIRVFESADLVLLETDIESKPVSAELVPILRYASEKPKFEEKIYALGFNGGSLGNQTQQLAKGHANPETLWFLVREQDQASLKAVGFPSMEIPIYFLQGSLLPGFSGSPIYNNSNELIGIGDGGLERGQMNVSWCIPASNLDLLESSGDNTLPEKLNEASLLYSAEVSIDVKSDDSEQNYHDASSQLGEKYKSYAHGEFNFYQTKTRTLSEMVSTAIDKDNLYMFATEFDQQKIFFDYNSSDFDFDIYEDVNNGFVIAIPVGTTLTYDESLNLFSAALPANDDNAGYFNLFYGMEAHDGDPVGEIISGFDEAFGKETNGLTRDPVYNKSHPLIDGVKADYFVLQGNKAYKLNETDEAEVLPVMFFCLISNEEEVFYSVALCFVPNDREELVQAFDTGVDCVHSYDQNVPCCDYFAWFFHVIAASQLTSLSTVQ